MKQKRKVKSLLPQEGLINGRFWTILLVVLSLILCVWSVSLLTHSVRAVDDEQYVIRYTDGVDGEEVFSDEVFNMLLGQPTPSYLGDTTRTNYVFVGWNPTVAGTVSGNATYEAQWKEDRNNNWIPDEDEYRTITYNDGVNDEVVFADQKHENQLDWFHTPQYNWDTTRTNYVFVGWNPTVAGTVSGNATYKAQWKEDRNNNWIPDDEDIPYKLTINYLYTWSNEIATWPYVLYGLLSGLEYTVNSPQIQYYYADKESVTVMIRGQDAEETVRYKPENDWNNNDIADQDENLQPINDFEFDSPVDNVQEVLYGMQFIDPLDVQKIVNNLYISGSNFYITPNPVILSGNTVDAGLYSHVLWWERNEVYSKNITLIAWWNNIINDGNENASILWWDGNQVRNGDWIPAILVWWENNIMKTWHSGNALIWWKGNSIEGWSNDFILWWEDNVIDLYSENVILWWKKIHIEDKNNIFVYSNSNYYLYPQSQNAFYLNMLSGVWINTGSSWIGWLSVGGAVSFGDVNISLPCVGGNLWVKWTYSGCLVWCTEKWKDNWWKWEMLDLWDKCAHLCTGDHILCGETVVEDERDNTLAECTTWVVNTDNAHLCMSGLLESYRWVVFESSLIDSDDECPNGENICVYKCIEGFHLTWDKATWKIGCYRNCDSPWGWTIRHNETVVAYNTGNVACSNDIYVFPRDTEMINQGQPLMTPLYTIVDITKNGIKYEKRAKNWKSYESCGNYDHKKTLICNNWVLELMDKNWKPIQNSSGLAQNYNLTGCNLYNYKCDTWVYKLTRNDIVNNKLDEPNDGNWDIADRSVLKWKRWRYTWCVDYDVSPNPTKNWESCTRSQYHYAFIRSKDHY